MQQVVINGRRSSELSITRSILQDSGLGPRLFLIYILEYADDLSRLCPQHSPSDLVDEFSHILRWAVANKLIIDSSKIKEIMFRRLSLRHYISSLPLMQIEQVEVKLLGILLTPHCLWNRMLS